MRKYLISSCFLSIFFLAHAQQCEVIPVALKGTYEGDCKKGKAHGTGKAKGEDSYVGNFKSGIPDGEGTYTWQNGSSFNGKWKNGFRDGEGTMKFKLPNGSDSLINGFWKKDIYIGINENPYKIYSKTGNVRELKIEFQPGNNSTAKFVVTSTTGGAPRVTSFTTKFKVDDIQIIYGGFMQQILYDLQKRTETVLSTLDLPFRAKYKIGGEEMEIEFFEKGAYIIDIYINN
jgi:hypothetical protein